MNASPHRPPWAERSDLERAYFDEEWGRKVITEHGLFERLSLEAFQSGLSWATILRKRPAFREVFHYFDPERILALSDADRAAAVADPRLIRNHAKHEALLRNAAHAVRLRSDPSLQSLADAAPARAALGGLADRLTPGLPVLLWSFAPAEHTPPARWEDTPSVSPESIAMAAELKRRGFAFVGPTTCYALMQATGMVDDRVPNA